MNNFMEIVTLLKNVQIPVNNYWMYMIMVDVTVQGFIQRGKEAPPPKYDFCV